jgi:hypothetical protein
MRPVAMVELRAGDWATLGADATALRMAVFVQEQGIDPAIELDAHDATAVHAVAYNRLAQPVATGRLLYEAPGDARRAAWPSIAWCAASAGAARCSMRWCGPHRRAVTPR